MEIIKINLENEMDLILSHKRCIKLAELCGLSVITQTAFATAVSEISRCVVSRNHEKPTLTLGIEILKNNRKDLVASVTSNKDFEKDNTTALKYAKRLFNNLKVIKHPNSTEILFTQPINFGGLINEAKLDSFISYFKKELPLSPYDELRKKNIQLLEVSEKLRESENQYRLLTETLPLMMFTTDAVGHITYANKWLKDFFKLTEINPGKITWPALIQANDKSSLRDEWNKSLNAGSSFSTQAKLKSKQRDELLWHLISAIPVKNENKQVVSWTGFFVDIHAQKQAEETLKNNKELKSAQKQLLSYQVKLEDKIKELNKSNHDLEQFAYIASHDLQEPLRKIRNFTDLLETNLDSKEKTKLYLGKIDIASSRMLSLIKDVLNYSRLSKGGDNFERTNLADVLKNVKLDMELMIEEKGAIINDSGLTVINALPQQLYQLFYNLISNSLKFSTTAPVINITCKEVPAEKLEKMEGISASGNHVEIIFKDNGIGFDQKYAKQVFTIFKRLNSKDSYAGTGIGLALCKKIIDNHHGSIHVTSELNKGSAFHILLPVE
ncbi:MAG: evgS [Bacteroidetes bacterium]|nr:evgS [Bacteroidota bacterium]